MGNVTITKTRYGTKYFRPQSYAGIDFVIPVEAEPETETRDWDVHSLTQPTTWEGHPIRSPKRQHSVIHQELYGSIMYEEHPIVLDTGFNVGSTHYSKVLVINGAGSYSLTTYGESHGEKTKTEHYMRVTNFDRRNAGQAIDITCSNGESHLYKQDPDGSWRRWSDSKYNDRRITVSTAPTRIFEVPGGYPSREHSQIDPFNYLWTQQQLEDFEESLTLKNPRLDYGEMCLRGSESIRLLDINGLAYIRDMRDIANLAKSIADLDWLKTIKQFSTYYNARHTGSVAKKAKQAWKSVDGGRALSSAASTYLVNHYGTKLTVLDTLQIAKAIERLDLQHDYQRFGETTGWVFPGTYGRYSDIRGERKITCDIRSWSDQQMDGVLRVAEAANQLGDRLLRMGYEADILPTLSNLWDLVPYSFVVDWFLPIGDHFERMEKEGYLHTLHAVRVFLSNKFSATAEYQNNDVGYTRRVSLRWRMYLRRAQGVFPPVPIMSEDFPGLSGLPKHWLEAAALVVQATATR